MTNWMPTTKRRVDWSGPDFYPTPAWATTALLKNEPIRGSVWEPACGNGAMSEVIKDAGLEVFSSDLFDRGYGKSDIDFLQSNIIAQNIITNPPFHSAEQFVWAGMRQCTDKLCLLLRLAFLESAARYDLFEKYPPSVVWVFSERITMYKHDADIDGSGTTAYAWFVWNKRYLGPTEIKWIAPRRR